ncbi:10026_t:CDS:2, partial [Acaulospora morrowiae]
MFGRTVVAVSALRKRWSKKQKSNIDILNAMVDEPKDNDLETIVSFSRYSKKYEETTSNSFTPFDATSKVDALKEHISLDAQTPFNSTGGQVDLRPNECMNLSPYQIVDQENQNAFNTTVSLANSPTVSSSKASPKMKAEEVSSDRPSVSTENSRQKQCDGKEVNEPTAADSPPEPVEISLSKKSHVSEPTSYANSSYPDSAIRSQHRNGDSVVYEKVSENAGVDFSLTNDPLERYPSKIDGLPANHSLNLPPDRLVQKPIACHSDQNKKFPSSVPSAIATKKSIVVSDEIVINSIVTDNVSPDSCASNNNLSRGIQSSGKSPTRTNCEFEFANKEVNSEEYVSICRPPRRTSTYETLGLNPKTHEIVVDSCLAEGTALLKVSAKKKQQRTFRIDVDQGRILWDSKKSGKVNIENIKEIRIGEAIRNYREHFKLSMEHESLWFTIIHVDSGKYKALHLVAPTQKLFNVWVDNLE